MASIMKFTALKIKQEKTHCAPGAEMEITRGCYLLLKTSRRSPLESMGKHRQPQKEDSNV